MVIQRKTTKLRKIVVGCLVAVLGLIGFGPMGLMAFASNGGGFNTYGYNYTARIFSGSADGVDKNMDGKVWGDSTYANDHLVMKWNSAWDACNASGNNSEAACAGAWVTNEWNGMVPGGSSETEHVKIIWVGATLQSSPYWVDGGTPIWDNYEILMDQGMANGVHNVYTFTTPNGLGQTKNN